MNSEWKDLTPEQKREKRYNWFLNPQEINIISPEAKANYMARSKRIIDAYKVEQPDRVPVSFSVSNTPAYLADSNLHTVMFDYEKLVNYWKKFNSEFTMDTAVSPGSVFPGKICALLDSRHYKWPDHGLPVNASGMQFVEGEYMNEDEYDSLINNPSDFWMRVYMPRAFGAFESWKLLQPFTSIIELSTSHFLPYSLPEIQSSLKILIQIGEEISEWSKYISTFNNWALESGLPVLKSGHARAPFDTIGDTLRGTRGIINDMYRQPEKLLEALEVITKITIDQTTAYCKNSKVFRVMFPLHKGADGFMSPKQFDTFYWPFLKRVVEALVEEGILPFLFAEGSFNSRLETVNEFPRGSVTWLFDRTDMAAAKKILGKNCCISGNIPTSLLITGTPEEVKRYCYKLIDDCGPGGGYILSAGASFDQGNPDNLRAVIDSVIEYGKY